MSLFFAIAMGTAGAALLYYVAVFYYVMLKQLRTLRRRARARKKEAEARLLLFWCASCRRRTLARRASAAGERAACARCGAEVVAETPQQRMGERAQRQEAETARRRAHAHHRRAERQRAQTEQERLWAEYLSKLRHKEKQAERPAPARDPKAIHCRAVLGVAEGASFREVKARYRALAFQYHPDKTGHLAERLRALAENETRKINEAYGYLRKQHERQKAQAA